MCEHVMTCWYRNVQVHWNQNPSKQFVVMDFSTNIWITLRCIVILHYFPVGFGNLSRYVLLYLDESLKYITLFNLTFLLCLYYSHLVLRGKVRQITNDPGELSLYLMWPRLDPITFIAHAEHQNTGHYLIIKPLISLNLTSAHYSFSGEVRTQKSFSSKDCLKDDYWGSVKLCFTTTHDVYKLYSSQVSWDLLSSQIVYWIDSIFFENFPKLLLGSWGLPN